MSDKLAVKLRHGPAEPVVVDLSRKQLKKLESMPAMDAVTKILQSVTDKHQPYAKAMLATLKDRTSVLELASPEEPARVVDRRSKESFIDFLSRPIDTVEVTSDPSFEIAVAKLQAGGSLI